MDRFIIWLIGVVIGVWFGEFMSYAILNEHSVSEYAKELRECEETLPRNQHCKLIAVEVDQEAPKTPFN